MTDSTLQGFPETAGASRKARAPSILIGGAWQADGSFKPSKLQPSPTTSEMADALAFYNAQGPGTTEFIRRVPGKLVVEKVEKTKASFN